MNEYQPGFTGITAADIQTARREYEQARFEERKRITAENDANERRAYDLYQRGLARSRHNSEGFGE